jgi:pentapeptide MXKDX repeat protein
MRMSKTLMTSILVGCMTLSGAVLAQDSMAHSGTAAGAMSNDSMKKSDSSMSNDSMKKSDSSMSNGSMSSGDSMSGDKAAPAKKHKKAKTTTPPAASSSSP